MHPFPWLLMERTGDCEIGDNGLEHLTNSFSYVWDSLVLRIFYIHYQVIIPLLCAWCPSPVVWIQCELDRFLIVLYCSVRMVFITGNRPIFDDKNNF
jgi:hypothetical protein